MRILHIMLSCFYVDNYNYQENILPRVNKAHGHDIKIIASTETFGADSRITYIEPSKYINEDGIPVVRLPYKKFLSPKLERKRRAYVGLYEEIESFKPDVIMCHGISFKDFDVVGRYKRNHQNVKVYTDAHLDKYNSGTSFVSKNILHKLYYKAIIKRNMKHIEKVFYVASTVKDVLFEYYDIDKKYVELMCLGGVVDSDETYEKDRKEYRQLLGVSEEDIVIVHSGKMDQGKKTVELVRAFSRIKDENMRLVIIGNILEEYKEPLVDLINSDGRILYLGWKSGEELRKYLNAGDVYAQPGTQSATLQTAACARNAIITAPYNTYLEIFDDCAMYADTEETIYDCLRKISEDNTLLHTVKNECYEKAQEKLDYNQLAKKIYV